MKPKAAFALIGLCVLAARLCHWNVVWVEEAYPLAAAAEMLRGKTLYRDIWFDKPPLFPAFYMLWGATAGVPLRIAGAVFVLACCSIAWWAARERWGQREGLAAAALLAFFLTFDFAPAVMALAPDLLMIAPHLAAVAWSMRGRPFASGVAGGLALLVNPKAPFVWAACLVWQWRAAHRLALGIAVAVAPAFLWFGSEMWRQVWEWGLVYSRASLEPLSVGLARTGGWMWFHAALVAGAGVALWRTRDWRLAAWTLISLAGVFAGMRFFPRYYFLLLPPVTMLAARAFTLLEGRWRIALLLLLAIPWVRFAPRYPMMAMGAPWTDLALHDDARAAGEILRRAGAKSLLVWGYRPEIFVYSGAAAGTRFLDSQPLNGVLADRHLQSAESAAPELAAANRRELIASKPEFIADGLGPLNPALAITAYTDLGPWLKHYREIARTAHTVLYRRLP